MTIINLIEKISGSVKEEKDCEIITFALNKICQALIKSRTTSIGLLYGIPLLIFINYFFTFSNHILW